MRKTCLLFALMALVFSGCADFTVETITGLSGNPQAVTTGDFDGNGMPDAVLGFGSDVSGIALAMQDDYGFWSYTPVSNVLFGGTDLLAVTDANDNDSSDVVVGGTDAGFLNLLRNNGDATFVTTTALLPDASRLNAIISGVSDVGRQLVVARYRDSGDATHYATFEATSGALQARQSACATPSTAIDADAKLRLTDVDGDGHLDLAAGNDDGRIEVFGGSAADFGNFGVASAQTLNGPGAGAVTAFAFGDAGTPSALQNWSVDGFTDLLVAYSSSPVVYGWRGQSGGGFAAPVALGGQEDFGNAPNITANIEIRGPSGAWGTNLENEDGIGGATGFIGREGVGSGYLVPLSCNGPEQSIIDGQELEQGLGFPGIVVPCGSGNKVKYIAYQRGRLRVTEAPSDFGEQLVGTQSAGQAIAADALDSHFTDESLVNEVNISEWRLEGDDAEDFTVTGTTGDCPYYQEMSLSPNIYHHNNCSAQVQFTPQSPGAKSARLVVVNNGVKAAAAPYQSVALEGFATTKLLTVTDSIDLGRVADTDAADVSVTNEGNRTINLTGFTISPAVTGWSASAGSCGATLDPGATCQASVSFGDGEPRESTASLVIAGDQNAAPTSVALTAQKVSGAVAGDDLDFGAVPVDDSSSLVATLTNDDEDATTFDSLEIEGADGDHFSIESEDCTDEPVAPDASCTATVTVSPSARGPLSASLRARNDSSVGDALLIDASGIQGVLAASPAEITFGSVAPATTADRTLTLTNEGDSALTLGAITAAPPFAATGNCSHAVLELDESCQVNFKFAPTIPGPFSTELSIQNDGEGGVRKVTLRGDAPAPPAASPAPPATRNGKPKLHASAARIAPGGNSARVVVSVTARGGPIKGAAVKIRLPRVLRWRPMSAARDSRNRARSTVKVPLGDLRAGSTRAFAVRLFSSRDLRDWRTSVKAVATSAQGSDSSRVVVGG